MSRLLASRSRDGVEEGVSGVLPVAGSNHRKVVLVESRRKKATEDFIAQIQALQLKGKNGERDWVEVYDWRLLEAVTKHEAKQARTGNTNRFAGGSTRTREIFRKYWVGLI